MVGEAGREGRESVSLLRSDGRKKRVQKWKEQLEKRSFRNGEGRLTGLERENLRSCLYIYLPKIVLWGKDVRSRFEDTKRHITNFTHKMHQPFLHLRSRGGGSSQCPNQEDTRYHRSARVKENQKGGRVVSPIVRSDQRRPRKRTR